MYPVEIFQTGKQLRLPVREILPGILVGDEVDRILQNGLDGKAGEVAPGFGQDAAAQQFCLGVGEGVGLKIEVIDGADDVSLFGD